ncbi:FkbM family methyltransferase [Chryseobacterium chendengshani]|uniref:FkbM family methyltransferase n=1 Tax=Chryseobacterium sp. LJ756 TaxID=2864113 RepID=UPI001C63E607|nr:FkbM family methyltransferase [Chryseobacterium sp. LJ756]MBW7675619.1 FkbM family methyltransferase [Chryseobacterium sp. LJ756]
MIQKLKKIAKIILSKEQIIYKAPISENDRIQAKRVVSWFADKGDETLRLNYDLNENSIVFDVGGYKGEFARDIFCKYQSNIYIFEPLKEFYEICLKRFIKNRKVHSYNFGLADRSFDTEINISDNASSIFSVGGVKTKIRLESITDFIENKHIESVDLIKINIEGGEYDLLESLIKQKLVDKFKNIQVQFHDFVIDNARDRMEKIQHELSKTHELTYQYDFVWENWTLKSHE